MLLEGRVIGLVEDDALMGESLVQSLTLEGSHVDWWRTGEEALRGLRATSPDLVICDIRLPDISGDELFRQLAARAAVPPFLFVTAFGDIDQAVSVMRAGAGDYITKPFAMPPFIMRAQSLIQRNSQAASGAVLGSSPAMRTVEETLRRVATLQSPVLITGETGSGKEVCARFLHRISPRPAEPFIAVNCAAIPGDVMERELFGAKGQGSQGFHHGFAERARSGILFLDEVADLAPALQAKLLRLVETREYNRLGGEQLLRFHGRIVCSTNADIGSRIEKRYLREDLLYRINAITVNVPPLRERLDDIPWLMDLFFEQFRALGPAGLRGVSTLAYDAALEYGWPGNVRELRNRLERAMALARTPWVMPADLFPEAVPFEHVMVRAFATLSETRDIAERRQIERALRQTGGQIIEASRLLGVSRTTLWDKMRRLGVDPEQAC